MKKLKVLDLFSGIGGFSLGLERTGGFETVAFCEIEKFPRQVLAKHWPDVPIYEDVRTLTGDQLGTIDLICGGYPCQPFSNAGKRKGADDDRHLWPEVHRLMASIRPTWGLFENVAGHVSMGLDQVLSDLEGEGYSAWPLIIPACALDAQHRRDRVWIVGYSGGEFGRGMRSNEGRGRVDMGGKLLENSVRREEANSIERSSKYVANAKRIGWEQVEQSIIGGTESERPAGAPKHSGIARGREGWCPEPAVGRVAHGVPSRVDRLKVLGNAVVPQIPEMIGCAILEAEGMEQ